MAGSPRSKGSGPRDRDPSETLSRIVEWVSTHADSLLNDKNNNLVGIGVGKKSAGPIDDESPYSVTAFVEEKLTDEQIKERGITSFAKAIAVKSGVRHHKDLEFDTDIVETGSAFQAYPGLKVPVAMRGVYGGPPPIVDLQKRFQDLRCGLGITNPHRAYPQTLSVGTIGFYVRDDTGRTYLVSNNHVIADENKGNTGDAVVQPGTLDLTTSELALMNTLATLNSHLKIASLSG